MSEYDMKKYPKIKRVGHKKTRGLFDTTNLIITEKMDGANFRFRYTEDGLIFGSRNVILGNETDNKQFKGTVDYIKEEIDRSFIKDHDYIQNLIFFGESMTKHSLEYDWENVPRFIGFDIYDRRVGEFLPYGEVKHIYNTLNLKTVPLIEKSKPDREKVNNYDIPDSEYRNGIAEGVVFKNYEKQVFGKLRSEEFFEKNNQSFGGGQKNAKNDSTRLVQKYCTNARIEKQIYKIRDETDYDIEMKMMEKLPKGVIRDIWEEEWDEIVWKHWTVDMKEMRSKISKRCVEVLRQIITQEGIK